MLMIKIVLKTAPLNKRCRRAYMNEATWSNIIWRLMISVQEKENPSNNNTFTRLISLKHTLDSGLTPHAHRERLLLFRWVDSIIVSWNVWECCCAECACTPPLTVIISIAYIHKAALYTRTCIYVDSQLQTSRFVS